MYAGFHSPAKIDRFGSDQPARTVHYVPFAYMAQLTREKYLKKQNVNLCHNNEKRDK